ncbi:MAG TPA: histidine phosphatase family protein [Candidatus Methylomirabilis sp.]|nr:histidine phosphatase family protein [Candidatus Methylomirabilis sp.]
MRHSTACLAALAIALLSAPLVAAQPVDPGSLRGAELLAALRGGGYILYFRHTDTDHSQHDTLGQGPQDCAKQRNLTDRGRDQARAIGQAIRALTIPIGPVLASPLCRTLETATLAFGTAERSAAARDAGPAPPGSPERFAELRRLLSIMPPKGTNTVIMGHAYPFYSLVGEAAIVQPNGAGFQVMARLGLTQWQELAKPAP